MSRSHPGAAFAVSAAFAALSSLICCATSPSSAAITATYDVALLRGGEELELAAIFPPGDKLELTVAPLAHEFIRDVQAEIGGRRSDLAHADDVDGGGAWRLPASSSERRVRWRFAARAAARALDRTALAAVRGQGIVGSLTAFLLHDDDARGGRFVLRARSGPGESFTCALARGDPQAPASAAAAGGGEWLGATGELFAGPRCAFGPIAARSHVVAGLTIEIVELEPRSEAASQALVGWAGDAARAIVAGFGRAPVDQMLLIVGPRRQRGVGSGTTWGAGGATTYVTVRRDATDAELAHDWVLVHEMIHVAFPSLAARHHWLEEGLAIYLEPLLRARQGRVTEAEVWRSLLADYPQGLPAAGDPGLDHVDSWARTYYGGAIFWLEADVAIRARTRNAKSIQDALRAIAAAGGNVTVTWPIERVIEIGDRATGTRVLAELYERMKDAPEPRELDSLWARLGVRIEGASVATREDAPLADVRRELVLGSR